MRLASVRPHAPALFGAALGVAVLCWLGLLDFGWSDYESEAAPAFAALLKGDLLGFLELAPAYGGSLVLRAPAAALPALWGGGEVAVWRAGSILCMLAAAGFGVWLVARMRAEGQSLLARGTALGLCVASPLMLRALEIGHPEEILGAVLAVSAVIAAGGRRVTLAGLLLGLAIATKMWALLAVGPVLVALPAGRWKALLIAGAIAAIVNGPILLADHGSFAQKGTSMTQTGSIFHPWQAWWFLGDADTVVFDGRGEVIEGGRAAPAWLTGITHPLIVLVAIPLTFALWRVRRGRVSPPDALLLLVLLLHLRCVLDVWNNVYYAIPAVLALLAWETLHQRRPPALTLVATVLVWVSFQELRDLPRDAIAAIYLAWAVPAALVLAGHLWQRRSLVPPRRTPLALQADS